MEFERHYTVQELAELWHVSEKTLRLWFKDEAVLRQDGIGRFSGRRRYATVTIPASIAWRVYKRHTQPTVTPKPVSRKTSKAPKPGSLRERMIRLGLKAA